MARKMNPGEIGLVYGHESGKTMVVALTPEQHQLLQTLIGGLGPIQALGGYYLKLMKEGKNGEPDRGIEEIG